eukprot:TRINITY_DN1258_c0_g1_i2.p1 TRINITY_DN1258_c0_g1~~TRINITY_DN1258_c0_g1_i2.p1  ORF type:complete len:446 (+),score=19.82 TRINITY_DN1258_c0_g1_i2:64-1338(+)
MRRVLIVAALAWSCALATEPQPLWTATTARAVRSNYRCDTATTVVSFPYLDSGDTSYASASYGDCLGTARNGFWYQMEAMRGYEYEISTCFNTTKISTQLEFYAECRDYCGKLCTLILDDLSCSPQSHVTFVEKLQSQIYFIFVSGEGDATGFISLGIYKTLAGHSSSEIEPSSSSIATPVESSSSGSGSSSSSSTIPVGPSSSGSATPIQSSSSSPVTPVGPSSSSSITVGPSSSSSATPVGPSSSGSATRVESSSSSSITVGPSSSSSATPVGPSSSGSATRVESSSSSSITVGPSASESASVGQSSSKSETPAGQSSSNSETSSELSTSSYFAAPSEQSSPSKVRSWCPSSSATEPHHPAGRRTPPHRPHRLLVHLRRRRRAAVHCRRRRRRLVLPCPPRPQPVCATPGRTEGGHHDYVKT